MNFIYSFLKELGQNSNLDCLEDKYVVSLKEISIFEKENENLGLGRAQYDTEFVDKGKATNEFFFQ